MKRLALLMAVMGMMNLDVGRVSAAPVDELTTIRDTLRQQLEQRMKETAAQDQPRDWLLVVSRDGRREPMTLTIMQRGNNWIATGVSGLGKNKIFERAGLSNMKYADGRLTGQLVVSWTAVADENASKDADKETFQQTYDLDVAVKASEERMILSFYRLYSGQDWVLCYKRLGKGWTYEKTEKAPRTLDATEFLIQYGDLEPAEDGSFQIVYQMRYLGSDGNRKAAYTVGNEPVVTVQGRLVDGSIDTTWLMKAKAGKHLLGNGQDLLTGTIQEAELEGKCMMKGDDGESKGVVRGRLLRASKTTVALDTIAPTADADALTRGAMLYRQIQVLDMARRFYPAPLGEIIHRVRAPIPVIAAGDQAAAEAYLNGLVGYARLALKPGDKADKLARGASKTNTERFGPFFGATMLPAVSKIETVAPSGPQQWTALGGWKMTGPFSITDQEAELYYPELLPVMSASFQRKRMFENPQEGTVEMVEDTVPWYACDMDGAGVYAPLGDQSAAGGERFFNWYATTEVASAADQTAWLAVKLEGQAMLWLNDDLVWNAGADYNSLAPAVFQVSLRKGTNRLLMRVASSRASNAHYAQVCWFEGYNKRPQAQVGSTWFAAYVATSGQPGPSASSASSAAKQLPADEQPVGYRRDGSGVFPKTNPPTAWDMEQRTNILWGAAVPRGDGDLVIRDGKLFLLGEPNVLFCLDALTGKELWKAEVAVPEAKDPNAKKNSVTNMASTAPVVTRDAVYAHFGGGAVACYGLDGVKKWETPTGAPWDHPNMGSPVLVDGRLIIQANLPGENGNFGLMAFDAANGQQLWTARGSKHRVFSELDWPSSFGNGLAVMRLVNGAKTRSVVITGDGAVIDAADGAILHRDIFVKEANRAAPYVMGDTVYNCPVMGEEAVQLWLDDQGRVGARTLWANPPAYGRGQAKTVTHWGTSHWMKGPLVDGDMLYVWRVDSAHVPQHNPTPWGQLEIFNRLTGERLARIRGVTTESTDPTIPPAMAGKYLYLGDGGSPVGGFGGDEKFGKFGIMEINTVTDDQKQALQMRSAVFQGTWGIAVMTGRMRTGKMRSAPVFEENRMYLRYPGLLVCIAETTPAGKAFAAESLARATLSEVIGTRPEGRQGAAVAPLEGFQATAEVPVSRLEAGKQPRNWIFAGPYPIASAAEMPGELLGQLKEGQEIAIGGKTTAMKKLDPSYSDVNGGIEIYASTGLQQKSVVYFYTILESYSRQTLKVDGLPDWVTMWINGKPVPAGTKIGFEIGHYPLLVRAQIGEFPPFLKSRVIRPSFSAVSSLEETPEQWEARAKLLRPRLEQIIKSLPGTELAQQAQKRLDQLDKSDGKP